MRQAVCTRYPSFDDPTQEGDLYDAVGRQSDFAGTGNGWRDHGWVTTSEAETIRIGRAVASCGLPVDVREDGQF